MLLKIRPCLYFSTQAMLVFFYLAFFRLAEAFVDGRCQFSRFREQIAANHHRVHNREYTCAPM